MITTRQKYVRYTKSYFRELQEKYGEIPENHREAIDLRMNFFRDYILHRVILLNIQYTNILYLKRVQPNIKQPMRKTGLTLLEENTIGM